MVETRPTATESRRILFGGDVMLGRTVAETILRNGPGYPLGPVAHSMRDADLTIVNLECAITSCAKRWGGAAKAFYFGAPLEAIETLSDAGVDLVSLANNHVLDFGVEGLRETLGLLRRHGIHSAGAGENSTEAARPCIIRCGEIVLGMAAFCDHQADFAATASRPGTAYIDLGDEPAAMQTLQSALAPLLRAGVDWPVLSLHWGPLCNSMAGLSGSKGRVPQTASSKVSADKVEAGLLHTLALPMVTLVDDVVHQPYQHASADDVS